ncbi:MAG TPA: tetratricopeptide repeat protein, partial [Pyrinomonadaceae bacterium]|nr:tetratricopeptide repeat protein [Pyrinomonadaceae bacterium]
AHYRKKLYSEAIKAFEQCVRLRPEYNTGHYRLGLAYLGAKDSNKAMRSIERAVELGITNGWAQFELAKLYIKNGRTDYALSLLLSATRLKPDLADAHKLRGDVYLDKSMYTEGINAYKEAIRIDPEYVDAYLGIGNAYYNQDLYEESLPHYKRVVELSPNYVVGNVYLADAYLNLKRYPEASSHYRTAILNDPKRADAYYGLGLCFVYTANKSEASAQLEKLRTLDAGLAAKLEAKIQSMK